MPVPDPGFGPALRRERERRGITLEAIADETKVSAALLAGLEDDDLSRWPGGIFRRAFVKGYAEAIGLDSTRVLADFLRHFPDQPSKGPNQPTLPELSIRFDGQLRLTLDETGPAAMLKRSFPRVPVRVMAIALDLVLLTAVAAVAGATWGRGAFWVIFGSLSVLCQLVTALRPGLSPGNRLFDCEPRPSSSGREEDELPIQGSLELLAAGSERFRKDRSESTPEI